MKLNNYRRENIVAETPYSQTTPHKVNIETKVSYLSKKTVKMIGWIGTGLLITAYALNTFGIISSTGLSYAVMNIIAAFFLGMRVYVDKNWSNLFLEFFWIGVALISIIRYFFF